jgi:hypothetical protein
MSKAYKTVGLIGLIVFDIALLTILSIYKQWYWVFFFGTVTTTVGLFEGLSKCEKGKTISQQFYKFRDEHPIASLLALIFFLASMISLAIHLF